jgi:hypothetical protein
MPSLSHATTVHDAIRMMSRLDDVQAYQVSLDIIHGGIESYPSSENDNKFLNDVRLL